MKEKEENEKKYDISKSNFFTNIPDNTDNQPKSEIKIQSVDNINTSLQNSQNINNINNPTQQYYQYNYFPPQNYYNHYPYQSQMVNYYSNQNISNPQTSSNSSSGQSLFQKVSETAMNLIKREDPLNLITDINPKFLDDLINKSKKEINCQILPKSKLSDIEDIKAIISNPRKINDSLLKNNYILYDITTSKMNWYVNRRYSDFIWLRDILISMFPTLIIPQLPKKKIGNRRFEEDFIQKRIKGLQNFLDEILKNDIIKTAEPLISFLSLTERNFFEQQMKIINPKNLNADNILNIKTFNGKTEIADMENDLLNNISNKNYFNSVENFFSSQKDEITEIKNNINEYNLLMLKASKHLEQIENGFNRLNQYYNKANLAKDISNVFEQYQIFCKNWKRIHINQTNIIKNKLKEFFKYLKNKGESLIELIKRQNDVQSEYDKIKENLNNKKENLWKKMDISKWEMNQMSQIDSALLFRDKNYAFSKMCFQETMLVNNKGDLLGFYYINNILNIKKVIENIEKYSVENLVNFSKEIEPTVTDVVNVWSNLASNL